MRLILVLTKAKKMPIGTVSHGRKKVAEGKWIDAPKDKSKVGVVVKYTYKGKSITTTRKVEMINGKPCVRIKGFRPMEITFTQGAWRPIDFEKTDIPGVGEYLYHGANEDILESIIKDGLQPGMRGQLSLSKTKGYAQSFARDGITPKGKTRGFILRVKSSILNGKITLDRVDGKVRPLSDQQNEVLTKETIPSRYLDISFDGGSTWKNLGGNK